MTDELVISRVLAASREIVFQAWSSADHVKHWFCPAQYSVPEAQVELRVGGAFTVCMQSAQGQRHWTRGRFTEIVPNSRLVIDMQVFDAQDKLLFRALTEANFAEQRGGSTRMDVKQTYTVFEALVAKPMIQGAPEGWRETLDRLEHELARIKLAVPATRSVAYGTFTLERTWPVSPAQVFRALTDPEAKMKWFDGGAGYTLLSREADIQPGGREHVSGRWDSGVVSTFDAVYHDIIENQRVVYSYTMHLDNRKISVSLATFELKNAGTGTRLALTEQGAFLDGYDDAGSRERGTGFLLDALGKSLLPGPRP
jgi:uncharacterized protein YndB with AHSA1/START domain